MTQTFKAAYPNEAILDPVAQMRKNLEAAKASTGEVGRSEFIYLAAALGEAGGALVVKADPSTTDAATATRLKDALSTQGVTLEETAPNTWQLRSDGGIR